jgi:3-oxoacyl-[acyl-carrier-protein] synthase-3
MKHETSVGILGYGLYLPERKMTAREIAQATAGVWSEEAVIEKLGIVEKRIPGPNDGTQQMGVWAAEDALERTSLDPAEIDLLLCMGEEWKEYPLTTSGIYIQEQIGARNAWAIDLQQRCGTTISAMKIAKDMMLADSEIRTVMVVGGYRNGDFVDYTDKSMSMMYNLAAAGGAIILRRDYGKNLLLGTHVITDGSMARDVGVIYGGTQNPINRNNLHKAYKSLTLINEKHMKKRLNDVSMDNWMYCIDKAFEKSGIEKTELGYLNVLHFKKSMYQTLLEKLNLDFTQSIYLNHYGHAGQIDQIISLHEGLKQGKISNGTVMSMIAAGIGYAWAANVIRW